MISFAGVDTNIVIFIVIVLGVNGALSLDCETGSKTKEARFRPRLR
jgi:hypothetical protein